MALEKMADARALSHSRAVQRNVRSLLTKTVGLHRLRRRGHNSAMAGKDDPSFGFNWRPAKSVEGLHNSWCWVRHVHCL